MNWFYNFKLTAMNLFIETERLYIRELLPEDEEGMYEMDSNPAVHKYIAQKPVHTRQESREVINYVRQQYKDNGVGRWAIIEKGSNDFLGWTGFKLMTETVNGQTNYYDYGYRLSQRAWGKGIATESGRASLQYGIEQMGLWPVFAMTDVNNAASRHVLEKLGFRFVEIFHYEGASQWRRAVDPMATWYELPSGLRSVD
jgi:RimJ/RimL family protein N-acetyltransferase